MRRPRAERRREPRLARSAAVGWDWSKACPAPGPPVVCAFNGQACADRVGSGPSKYLLLSKAASGRAELLVVALHRERDDRAAPEGGTVASAVVAAVQLDPEGEQASCDEDCEGGEAPCQHDHVARVAAAAFENLRPRAVRRRRRRRARAGARRPPRPRAAPGRAESSSGSRSVRRAAPR